MNSTTLVGIKMTVDEAVELLTIKGYKEDKFAFGDSSTRYFYRRTEGPDCRCNERPPAIGVSIYTHKVHNAVEIGLRAETVEGQWVDFKYYAMALQETGNVDSYARYLSAMWKVANLKEEAS